MAIRAKFFVQSITRRASGSMGGYAEPVPLGDVVMRPVSGKDGNEEWASATPSGEFKMTVRTSALDEFEALLGQDVDILITPSAPTE